MENYLSVPEENINLNISNISCDESHIPTIPEYFSNLKTFGTVFISIGSILTITTIILSLEFSYRIIHEHHSDYYKKNSILILFLYPIASICSLISLSIPRTQLVTETIIQMALTITMYRLYLLIIHIGEKSITEETQMTLKVGPCCCWPCLPFPNLHFNPTNLSWLQIIVLQFPIIQGSIYIVFLLMYMEDPQIYYNYNTFLQPLCVSSILLALYGLNIAIMSLKQVYPERKLQLKGLVVQLVLFFSKLQATVIKYLPLTGIFPCNAPITPQLYANITYNTLMLIEMLLLCYVARHLYRDIQNIKKSDEELPPIVSLHLQRQSNKVRTGIPIENITNNNNNNTNNNVHVQLAGSVTA